MSAAAVTVRTNLGAGLSRVRGKSAGTTALYRAAVADFLAWCQEEGERPTLESASGYMEAVRRRRKSAAYVNTRLYALRAAFRQAAGRAGATTAQLAVLEAGLRELHGAKVGRPDVRVVSTEERLRLYEALPLRVRLLAETLYLTGARVSELVGLTTEDVLREDGEAVPLPRRRATLRLRGKGGRERTVPVPASLLERVREAFKPEPGGPLFLTTAGQAFNRRYVSRELDRAARRVLGRSVTAHQLRHSRATDLYQDTRKVKAIADMLGHASEATTLRYYVKDSLTDGELFGREGQ